MRQKYLSLGVNTMHLISVCRRHFAQVLIIAVVISLISAAKLDNKIEVFENKDEKTSGRDLLQSCNSSAQCIFKNKNSYCMDGQCFCAPRYVMLVKDEELHCFPTARISDKCIFNEQCQSANTKTVCIDGRCQCKVSYKSHPECRYDKKFLPKQFSMSYLINTVMASIVGVITFLFLLSVFCFKCQKDREANQLQEIRRITSQNRQSVMSSGDVEKPPSYDEIYIGTRNPTVESPTLLRPPSYNQIFVYGEVAVPGNYPINVEEDFPSRR